jgi:hypothetical protein
MSDGTEPMAYQTETRAARMESLLRQLTDAHRKLCRDYAEIGGTEPEELLPLRADLDLIAEAEAALENTKTDEIDG